MAEFKNGAYEPGTYVKGDQTRVADTAADAVQAVWDGFTRQSKDSDVDFPTASVNNNDPEAVRAEDEVTDADDLDFDDVDLDDDDTDPNSHF